MFVVTGNGIYLYGSRMFKKLHRNKCTYVKKVQINTGMCILNGISNHWFFSSIVYEITGI